MPAPKPIDPNDDSQWNTGASPPDPNDESLWNSTNAPNSMGSKGKSIEDIENQAEIYPHLQESLKDNLVRHLPELGAYLGSEIFPPAALATKPGLFAAGVRSARALIPPALGGSAGKVAENVAEGAPATTNVLGEGLKQSLYSLPLHMFSEAGGLVARVAKSSEEKLRAIKAGTLYSAATKASLDAAEKLYQDVKARAASSSAFASQMLGNVTDKISKGIGMVGSATTKHDFGTLTGQVVAKAKDVAIKQSNERFQHAFAQLKPVNLSDYADQVMRVDPSRIEDAGLAQKIVGLQKSLEKIQAYSSDPTLRKKMSEHVLAEIPFADAHKLKSVLGSQGATSGLATPVQGAAQYATTNIGDFLKAEAAKQGLGNEYLGALAGHKEYHRLFGKGSLGAVLAKTQKLDPQNALKLLSGEDGVKRVRDFHNIVYIINHPSAANLADPAEIAHAKEAAANFAHLYLEGLNKGDLKANIDKYGRATLSEVLSGLTKSKDPAKSGKRLADAVYQLAKDKNEALSALKSTDALNKVDVKSATKNLKQVKAAAESEVKENAAKMSSNRNALSDMLVIGILSAAKGGIHLPIPLFLLRRIIQDSSAAAVRNPQMLDGLAQASIAATKDRTLMMRRGHLLYAAVKFYIDSPDGQKALDEYNKDPSGQKQADLLVGKHLAGMTLEPDEVSHLREHREGLQNSMTPPSPLPLDEN